MRIDADVLDSCNDEQWPKKVEKLSRKEQSSEFDLGCSFLRTESDSEVADEHSYSFLVVEVRDKSIVSK
jgi:hypothetical protein